MIARKSSATSALLTGQEAQREHEDLQSEDRLEAEHGPVLASHMPHEASARMPQITKSLDDLLAAIGVGGRDRCSRNATRLPTANSTATIEAIVTARGRSPGASGSSASRTAWFLASLRARRRAQRFGRRSAPRSGLVARRFTTRGIRATPSARAGGSRPGRRSPTAGRRGRPR